MNKQELIKSYENVRFAIVSVSTVLEDLKQLDEPHKPFVPQFVADWIEKCKSEKIRLHESLTYTPCGVNGWISNPKNQEIFARAWLDGYTVYKEKRYLVKMKGIGEKCIYLNYDSYESEWYLADEVNNSSVRTHHTAKQLEDAGFGDVFNSPLFEVEDVEE